MLARLQQAITLGLILFASLWAIVCLRAGAPGWALLGSLSIVFGYAFFLALECLLASIVNRGDPAPPASGKQLAQAWWSEVMIAPRVFCWRQPFRPRAWPDRLPTPDSAERRGVLLVHGFVCNRGLWNPWSFQLQARGTPFVAVDLEPVFGSIDAYAEIIDAAVLRLERATGLSPLIVAHSMGGLAVRAWLARFDADDRVARVVTVGTPHAGTWLARFSFSRNGVEMRRGSGWFKRLSGREPAHRYRRFTCFYSHCDNIVFPASTATLPGADNRHIPGCAHVDLLFHPEVFSEVLRLLDAPPSGGPT